jgi:hypothetical protein
MLLLCLFVLTPVLWQEDFIDGIATMSQLYEYEIEISHLDGKVILNGNPQFEGFSSAWFYLDSEILFSENDILELKIKVNNNKMRLNYFYRKKGSPVYYAGEEIISASEDWQQIKLPLMCAKPFYSSNFPFALTPDKTPALYIFIDNLLPGTFNVEIDKISVQKCRADEEEMK